MTADRADRTPADLARAAVARHVLSSFVRQMTFPYLQYFEFGIPVSAEHLRWLSTAQPDTSSDSDAATISLLADHVPQVGEKWGPNLPRLSHIYSFWLDHAVVPAGHLSADERQQLKIAESILSTALPQYRMAEASWKEAQTALSELAKADNRDAAWQRQLRDAKNRMSVAASKWISIGRKAQVESAMATVDYLTRQAEGLAPVLREHHRRYRMYRTVADAAGRSVKPIALRPPPLANDANWTSVRVDFLEDIPDITPNVGGAVGRPTLWQADALMVPRILSNGPAVSGIDLELGYSAIDRLSWFDSTILLSQLWQWDSVAKDSAPPDGPILSNGLAPPNTRGQLQMIPHGLVLARNITLSGGADLASFFTYLHLPTYPVRGFWTLPLQAADGGAVSTPPSVSILNEALRIRVSSEHTFIIGLACSLTPPLPNPE